MKAIRSSVPGRNRPPPELPAQPVEGWLAGPRRLDVRGVDPRGLDGGAPSYGLDPGLRVVTPVVDVGALAVADGRQLGVVGGRGQQLLERAERRQLGGLDTGHRALQHLDPEVDGGCRDGVCHPVAGNGRVGLGPGGVEGDPQVHARVLLLADRAVPRCHEDGGRDERAGAATQRGTGGVEPDELARLRVGLAVGEAPGVAGGRSRRCGVQAEGGADRQHDGWRQAVGRGRFGELERVKDMSRPPEDAAAGCGRPSPRCVSVLRNRCGTPSQALHHAP